MRLLRSVALAAALLALTLGAGAGGHRPRL